MTIRATAETAAALQQDLRRWVWDGLRRRFAAEVAPAQGRASTWGHAWEVVSMAGIIPADPTAHDLGAALVRLVDTLTGLVHVERPGGLLVVRGVANAAFDIVPDGIQADLTPIGTHAYRVRLAAICHAVTLDEARAHRRATVKAEL